MSKDDRIKILKDDPIFSETGTLVFNLLKTSTSIHSDLNQVKHNNFFDNARSIIHDQDEKRFINEFLMLNNDEYASTEQKINAKIEILFKRNPILREISQDEIEKLFLEYFRSKFEPDSLVRSRTNDDCLESHQTCTSEATLLYAARVGGCMVVGAGLSAFTLGGGSALGVACVFVVADNYMDDMDDCHNQWVACMDRD